MLDKTHHISLLQCSKNLTNQSTTEYYVVLIRIMYGVRNLEMTIRFSLKSRPSERFHRPEMSQIKAEISFRTNVKLIFHKNVGLQ